MMLLSSSSSAFALSAVLLASLAPVLAPLHTNNTTTTNSSTALHRTLNHRFDEAIAFDPSCLLADDDDAESSSAPSFHDMVASLFQNATPHDDHELADRVDFNLMRFSHDEATTIDPENGHLITPFHNVTPHKPHHHHHQDFVNTKQQATRPATLFSPHQPPEFLARAVKAFLVEIRPGGRVSPTTISNVIRNTASSTCDQFQLFTPWWTNHQTKPTEPTTTNRLLLSFITTIHRLPKPPPPTPTLLQSVTAHCQSIFSTVTTTTTTNMKQLQDVKSGKQNLPLTFRDATFTRRRVSTWMMTMMSGFVREETPPPSPPRTLSQIIMVQFQQVFSTASQLWQENLVRFFMNDEDDGIAQQQKKTTTTTTTTKQSTIQFTVVFVVVLASRLARSFGSYAIDDELVANHLAAVTAWFVLFLLLLYTAIGFFFSKKQLGIRRATRIIDDETDDADGGYPQVLEEKEKEIYYYYNTRCCDGQWPSPPPPSRVVVVSLSWRRWMFDGGLPVLTRDDEFVLAKNERYPERHLRDIDREEEEEEPVVVLDLLLQRPPVVDRHHHFVLDPAYSVWDHYYGADNDDDLSFSMETWDDMMLQHGLVGAASGVSP
jgi:hypothetical protein